MTVSLIFGASRTEFLMKGAQEQEHEEEQLYNPALQPNNNKSQKTFDHTQHMVKKHWQRQDDGTR